MKHPSRYLEHNGSGRDFRSGKKNSRQAGFILTLELVLISTVLIIGSFVGIVAIRDSLIKHYAAKQSHDIFVYDQNGLTLGKVMGFDADEAPLIPYIDRTLDPAYPDPAHRNFRALIGIRDDRFTGRETVYYAGKSCTGTPCIKSPSDEDTDRAGLVAALDGAVAETRQVGYLYGLQGGPTYGVGQSADGARTRMGFLYRSTPAACPFQLTGATRPQSVYVSQRVVSEAPCEDLDLLGTTAIVEICIPGALDCYSSKLVRAESVPDPDDASRNAFERFEPPFQVSLPPNLEEDSWTHTTPDGEG